MAEFLTDVETLRARARHQIEQGPITEAYGADRNESSKYSTKRWPLRSCACFATSGTTTPPPGSRRRWPRPSSCSTPTTSRPM